MSAQLTTIDTDKAFNDILTHVRNQRNVLPSTDHLATRLIGEVLSLLNQAQEKLDSYHKNHDFYKFGPVRFHKRAKCGDDPKRHQVWWGTLQDGSRVILRTQALGPGEEYVQARGGQVWVKSYAGALRYPPFVQISGPDETKAWKADPNAK